MDHQLGFIQSLRYSRVGHTMGSFAATKYIRPIDLDFTMPSITIKQVSFAMVLVLAESFTYYLVCDKGAC